MSTIQIKGSYKRVNHFIKEGGILLENIEDNKIIITYKNYLISIDNKESTISHKIRFIYFQNILHLLTKLLKPSSRKIYMIILKNAQN